jgi:hypothetical protein
MPGVLVRCWIMRKFISVVTICVLIASVFSGCSLLQKLGLAGEDELQPASSIVMGEEEAQALSDKVPIHLYFTNADSKKLVLEVRYITLAEAKKSNSSLASLIVKELINGPSKTSGLVKTIPDGTKLVNSVSISSGVATVDLSKEFIVNHPGGKDASAVTIYSVVNSLTELKDISKVKFTIEGKAQSDFKDSFKFNSPFPRNDAIISQDVKSTDKSDTSGSKSTDSKKKVTPTPTQKSNDASKKTSTDDGSSDVQTSGDGAGSDDADLLE